MADATVKGLPPPPKTYDGSSQRILIVHARWNAVVIESLVAGCVSKLKAQGVKEENIVIRTVPGSYELPFACQKLIAGSQVQAATNEPSLIADVLSMSSPTISSEKPAASTTSTAPFSAVIAIGVLIKGSTMHFEYIADAVTHGLMRVQLDTGVPLVFGVLTALTDDQALDRAGLGRGANGKGHNHGEDWGLAAVELAANAEAWAKGDI